MADKMQFPTNVPQTVALKYATGKRVESRYNDYEVYFTLIDNPPLYASPALADKIAAFQPEAGVPFSICKREIKDGNKKRIEWQVLPLSTQPEQQVARPAAPAASATQPYSQPNGSSSPQHSSAPGFTQLFGGALVAAIDALAAAREYGKTRGFALEFNEEDVRAAAASIFIQYCRAAENSSRAFPPAAPNGGAVWRQ